VEFEQIAIVSWYTI